LDNLLGNLTQSAVDSQNVSTAFSMPENSTQTSDHTINNAIVVHCFFEQSKNTDDLTEFQLLAKSANVHILNVITATRLGVSHTAIANKLRQYGIGKS
jgi:GTPase